MKRLFLLVLLGGGTAGLLFVLQAPLAGVAPLGRLLDPAQGLYHTARRAAHPEADRIALPALGDPVTVLRDLRGVPHIFAESNRDAITALGYVVAQDRLFQLDFLTRVASGRLAAALGPSALGADRFLRHTGMEWGVRKNARRIRKAKGIEEKLGQWYVNGVNAYLATLSPADLPFEFRLLDYAPDPYTLADVVRVLAYMAYDLTYGTDRPGYTALRDSLGAAQYERLFPRYSRLTVPIIPPGSRDVAASDVNAAPQAPQRSQAGRSSHEAARQVLRGTAAEGYRPGKGSNNWAVGPGRSATGAPILAGDMHLALSLPAIWYEVHLVTPTMNTYGVTIPGSPLPIEAFNDHVGWTFTNTGADQIDHYDLTLDSTGTRYAYEGEMRPLRIVQDTIPVKGEPPVVDTMYFAHWGPLVEKKGRQAMAIQWVGHKPSRTLRALWGMNQAKSYGAFREALRYWDTPMQNILFAGRDSTIAIRSTGYLPRRRAGHGVGLLDGATDAFAWTGRVPFDELPHARRPAQGYLTSTNQQPTDSTYAHYLGHDWRSAYRSLRIDTLLRGKRRHTVADLKRYQMDVHAVQRDLFVPLLDTLSHLPPRPDTLRHMLEAWSGETAVDRPEPLALSVFLDNLYSLAWDEPVFMRYFPPQSTRLYRLMTEEPTSRWLDVQKTPRREGTAGLLRQALESAADTLAVRYGWGRENWRWGDHHQIVFPHLTNSEALRPLWRGPVGFPGFEATLLPAGSMNTTHSASWRMVVDFSGEQPVGYGVYPGGQSGNPFSPFYDLHLPVYLSGKYYDLGRPATPDALDPAEVSSRLRLTPGR